MDGTIIVFNDLDFPSRLPDAKKPAAQTPSLQESCQLDSELRVAVRERRAWSGAYVVGGLRSTRCTPVLVCSTCSTVLAGARGGVRAGPTVTAEVASSFFETGLCCASMCPAQASRLSKTAIGAAVEGRRLAKRPISQLRRRKRSSKKPPMMVGVVGFGERRV